MTAVSTERNCFQQACGLLAFMSLLAVSATNIAGQGLMFFVCCEAGVWGIGYFLLRCHFVSHRLLDLGFGLARADLG